jgi:PAS domain S-box-containing protein
VDGYAPVLRGAVLVLAVLVPTTAAALTALSLVTGIRGLLAWSVLGWILGGVCVVEAVLRRADIEFVVVVAALGVAVTARVAPPTSVPAVVAGSVMIALVLFTMIERTPRTVVAGVATATVHGYTLITIADDWGAVAGAGILMAAGIGTWLVLDRLVNQMRKDHSSYRELFDRVPVALYRTGLGGELLDVNPALAELLGMPREDLLGRRAQEFFVDVDDFSRLRAAIGDRTDSLTTDIRFRRPDGALIWVRDQTRPVTDDLGRIVCFEGELQDITEQRRHLDELEALVRSKSELIGAVSHELRTPLTAVVGFLELLQSGGADTERAEMLALAADQARDIAGIVDDLLTAARLDNQELVVQESTLDIRGPIDGAVTSVTGGRQGEVVVTVPRELMAFADGARVRQVLRNLIGNAMRYGRPPIEVCAKDDDGLIHVVVADHGPEISPDVVARMFDAFFSGAETSTRQPGSIGLGLAVSHRLARLMGGDLRYERVGNQTQFTLELRAASVAEMAESA